MNYIARQSNSMERSNIGSLMKRNELRPNKGSLIRSNKYRSHQFHYNKLGKHVHVLQYEVK